MSRLGPEPRINSRLLDQYKGQTIRLTAKIIKLEGETATVEASDGGQVGLHLSRDMHLSEGYYEIIGTVKEDKSVRALTSIELGPSLDMASVNAVVELAQTEKAQGVLA